MKKSKKILLLSLTFLLLISCGQTKTEKQFETKKKNNIEKEFIKIISDSTNKLSGTIEELEVVYTVWGCACPNWIRTKEVENYDTSKSYLSLHFYIEPAVKRLEIPEFFDVNKHYLKIKGQFYERADYPKGTIEMEESIPKAKVFRYTELEVLDKPIQ